jgi:Protein of unknown function (DUF1036)
VPLNFHNATGSEAWLAALFPDSGCGPTDQWRKQGWWGIAPGSTFQLLSGDNRSYNRYMGYHADGGAESGSPCWTNNPHMWYWIPANDAFNQCYDDNNNCNAQEDFEQIDFAGRYGLTITLLDRWAVSLTYYDPPASPPPPPHDDSWSGGDDEGDDEGGGEE